jgi:uncharacterized protein DUF4129
LRREFGLLVPALFLGLFIVSVGSLAASIRSIDVSKLPAPSIVVQPTAPTLLPPNQIASVAGSDTVAWLIIVSVAVVSVVLLILARKRQSAAGSSMFWRLMGLALGVAIFLLLINLIKGITAIVGGAQRELTLDVGLLSLAAALAFMAALATLAWFERSRFIHASASLEEKNPIQGIQKLLESVRRRIYSMPRNEVYRDSVIACYSAMTGLLAKQGAEDKPSFTPRELETSASSRLAFEEADIHLLTRLFEKARYADATVTEREAQDSVDALERMANEVATKSSAVGIA